MTTQDGTYITTIRGRSGRLIEEVCNADGDVMYEMENIGPEVLHEED